MDSEMPDIFITQALAYRSIYTRTHPPSDTWGQDSQKLRDVTDDAQRSAWVNEASTSTPVCMCVVFPQPPTTSFAPNHHPANNLNMPSPARPFQHTRDAIDCRFSTSTQPRPKGCRKRGAVATSQYEYSGVSLPTPSPAIPYSVFKAAITEHEEMPEEAEDEEDIVM
ncbi:hypothetical protein BD779DRAFT_1473362 [Infundibulicybe gibba]|nr:hypothetical protein BD779DRAFT_1473362 [Infundibulicybe gibba]